MSIGIVNYNDFLNGVLPEDSPIAAAIAQIHERITKLRNTLTNKTAQLFRTTAENAPLDLKPESVPTKDLRQLFSRINGVRVQGEKTRQDIENTQSSLKKVKEQAGALMHSMNLRAEMQTGIQKTIESKDLVDRLILAIRVRLLVIRLAIIKLYSVLAKKIDPANIEKTEKDVKNIKEQIDNLELKYNDMKRFLDALSSHQQAYQKELDALFDQHRTLQEEESRLIEDLDSCKTEHKEIATLIEEIKELDKTLETEKAKLQQFEASTGISIRLPAIRASFEYSEYLSSLKNDHLTTASSSELLSYLTALNTAKNTLTEKTKRLPGLMGRCGGLEGTLDKTFQISEELFEKDFIECQKHVLIAIFHELADAFVAVETILRRKENGQAVSMKDMENAREILTSATFAIATFSHSQLSALEQEDGLLEKYHEAQSKLLLLESLMQLDQMKSIDSWKEMSEAEQILQTIETDLKEKSADIDAFEQTYPSLQLNTAKGFKLVADQLMKHKDILQKREKELDLLDLQWLSANQAPLMKQIDDRLEAKSREEAQLVAEYRDLQMNLDETADSIERLKSELKAPLDKDTREATALLLNIKEEALGQLDNALSEPSMMIAAALATDMDMLQNAKSEMADDFAKYEATLKKINDASESVDQLKNLLKDASIPLDFRDITTSTLENLKLGRTANRLALEEIKRYTSS